MPRKPEALIEREVLLAVGRSPDLLIARNEVGHFHPAVVGRLLQKALAPWGAECVAAALRVLVANRTVCGLGVGSPDLVYCVAGRAGGLELKAADGVVSAEQERWHAAARRRGMRVDVVRSAAEAAEAIDRCRSGQ